MANLSQETQAIIDRLKAEGDLVRNSGTNSIRSVKFQLDKFEGIFDTISTNIAEQTDILRLQAGIAQEQIERDRNKEQFEEVTPKEQYDDQQENKSNKLVTDNENAKINKIGDSISSALSLKNIMLASAGIFVGYNFIKGYINESTGGGFDRMIEGIKNTDFAAMGTTITAMTTGLGNINWTNFSTAVNNASTMITNFSTWLGETGVGDIVATVIGGGLVTAGARGAASGVMGALGKGGGKGAGFAGRLAGIGPGIALAAAGLAIAYGDEIGAYIDGQLGTTPDAAGGGGTGQDVVNIMSAGVTIAGLFGFASPIGIAALAIAGTVSLGLIIADKVGQFKEAEREKFNTEVDEALAAARAADDATNLDDDTANQLAIAAAEARRRTQLFINDAAIAEAEASLAEIQQIQGQQQLGDGTEGVNRLQLDRIREQAMTGDQAAIDELMAWAQGREKETSGSFFRWISGEKDPEEFIRSIITNLGPELEQNGDVNEWLAATEAWEAKAAQILEERGYRRGTGGFKNFGSGTAAILHGTEAVVPLNSPEGQILKNLFNGNTPADVVSNAGSSAGGGAPVIINAPVNTSSPTILNQAGSTVSQISYSGGSGSAMGPSLLPYGITGSIA